MKYTEGKWEVCEHNWSDTSIYAVLPDGTEKHIAKLSIYDEATEDTQEALEGIMSANAKLIAAAPDMYEACAKMLKAINEAPSEWLMTKDVGEAALEMKDALSKATN